MTAQFLTAIFSRAFQTRETKSLDVCCGRWIENGGNHKIKGVLCVNRANPGIMPPRPKAKKAKNISGKFASKVVGEILENLIQNKIKKVKQNPKTTAKWMEKMKLSVLKKLSHASKVAFAASESSNVVQLQAEITQLRGKIQQQTESVRQLATAHTEKTNFKVEQLDQTDDMYVPGRFEQRVQRIKERLDVFAPTLAHNIKEMGERVNAFQQSVAATEGDWKQSSKLLQQRAAAAAAAVGTISGPGVAGSAVLKGGSTNGNKSQQALKDKQGPAETLYNVLGKS
jgi:hypothetical protein